MYLCIVHVQMLTKVQYNNGLNCLKIFKIKEASLSAKNIEYDADIEAAKHIILYIEDTN